MNTSSILIQSTTSEWENNIILQEMENGNFVFSVLSNRVGNSTITLYFVSDNYNSISIDIQISIVPMPTLDPIVDFPSELVIGEALVISSGLWQTNFGNNVPIEEFQLLNDTLLVNFTLVEVTEYSFTISIDTEDLRQGFHNLTLQVSSYGYENHSVTIFVELIGREIEILIEISPDELIQGSDFTITAILTYASLQANLVGHGSELLLVPLDGIPVTFLVRIRYANGSILPLSYENSTNEIGEAKFTVSGEYTLSAEGIESITVSSEATASGKEGTYSTPSNFFDVHRFEKKTGEIPEELFLFGILIFSLIGIFPLSLYTIRKRKKVQEPVRDTKVALSPDLTPKDTPELVPDVAPPIKEIDDERVQPLVEDKAETERIKTLAKKPEEAISEMERQEAKPSSWIAEFPPAVSKCEKEIRFLFILVLKREGKWYGRTSYNFLLKQKPKDLSTTNLRKVYMTLPQQTVFFKKEKTSIIITDKGKEIALRILKKNDQ
jgi:hypothetical protein